MFGGMEECRVGMAEEPTVVNMSDIREVQYFVGSAGEKLVCITFSSLDGVNIALLPFAGLNAVSSQRLLDCLKHDS